MLKSRDRLKSQQMFSQINKSPTNNSLSKQTHSFSKSPRFPQIKTQCPVVSYGGSALKTEKGRASIGYGQKSDFTKDLSCSPPPSKYQIKAKIEENVSRRKGYSLGVGRQRVRFYSYIDRELIKNPRPNQYNVQNKMIKKLTPRFSLRSRTKVLDKSKTIEPQNDNPGPGNYFSNQHLINRSSISYRKLDNSSRFKSSENRVPGPGSYNEAGGISGEGRYYLSRHQDGKSSKFSQNKRLTKFDEAVKKSEQIPPVGSYRTPSQFGYYDIQFERLRKIYVKNPEKAKKK